MLCGPVTEPRSLSLDPSRSPTHLIGVPASSPPQTPGCPGRVSLDLGCLDIQPRPLPIKLALGRSEVALFQDQIGVPGATHVLLTI